jgi:CheY-like chemotaxis protein
MQLPYNILWIDNDLSDYIERGQIERLKVHILDLGFEPNIITNTERSSIATNLTKARYDLIISDYDLGEEIEAHNGIEVVNNIREQDYLTEILFYTGNSRKNIEEDLRNELKNIDRITIHLGRETLLERIETLIELTVQKLLEIDATRGLITSITSTLDVYMEIIAHKLLDNILMADKNIPAIQKTYISDYRETKKSAIKQCISQRDIHQSDFKQYYSNSVAYRKWYLLKQFLKTSCPKGFDVDLFGQYFEEVINVRNRFAHAKSEEIDGVIVLKGQLGKEDFQFDKQACIQIRKNLILHKKNFNVLLEYFQITP